MTETAIRVEDLSKKFRIGAAVGGKNLREALMDKFKAPIHRARDLLRGEKARDYKSDNIIWALKDVSFEIKDGEAVGIIGGNGAGKSTLLKIISRITEPTKGYAEMRGRVGSLLEVGTGFHSELTGRENIYLNGAILGMKRTEIQKKFDEIVAFSEVGKFIDTPVKRYSSGMYLRLAFAVAAHLEPEILIVDEVLAVGDAQFQKKCLGKMGGIIKEGRTVLFVSHNMGAITRLCNRALWLQEGTLKMEGRSDDVVSKYASSDTQEKASWIRNPTEDGSRRWARLKYARVFSDGNDGSTPFSFNQNIKIEMLYEIARRIRGCRSYIILKDSSNNILWASHDTDDASNMAEVREPGAYQSTCTFPEKLLRPGRYHVSIGVDAKSYRDVGEERLDVMSFDISETDYPFNLDPRMGLITPCLYWKTIWKQDASALETVGIIPNVA
jgi:lipopolysaccharide transport system ATP-binding protein